VLSSRHTIPTVGFALFLLCAELTNRAEESPNRDTEDLSSRKLALSVAMPRFYSPGVGFLRALRTEEYDEPFQPTWSAPKGLRAFLITDTGVEFSAGRVNVHTSTGRRELLVLVDPNKNKAYALRGLGNPVEGFNALVKDMKLTVGRREKLWTYSGFSLTLQETSQIKL
jgi:hypothetical protein